MNPYGKRVDIVMARGERWKKVRSVASPAFSAMKMKQVGPYLTLFQFLKLEFAKLQE